MPDPMPDPMPNLTHYAREPDGLATLAIVGAIESARDHGLRADLWLRGMDAAEWARMMDSCFPGAAADPRWPSMRSAGKDGMDAEFKELFELLNGAAAPATATDRHWLSCAIASACLFDDHLWSDLRLPDRAALSRLMHERFPGLAVLNVGGAMRWKAFFYKQICERSGQVCRAPSCGACDDYGLCFGPE